MSYILQEYEGLRYKGQEYKEILIVAGWSSLVARQAHNLEVGGSNPPPATNLKNTLRKDNDIN